MSKYSFELKLKVVLDYLSGESGGYALVAGKHGIKSETQVENWVNNYRSFGEEGLERKSTKTFYSGEFKLRVLQYRQNNNCSYREAADYFGINNPSMIANWQRKYLDEGFKGLNKSIGRPINMSKDKKKKDPFKLINSEKEELIRLREENEFLKASLAYEKKLKALVREREQGTRRKRK
ncbi:MAG: transposase [Firmicutes bacterium]|jgi:transposase|nr:transposase [Bacillota bacterium]